MCRLHCSSAIIIRQMDSKSQQGYRDVGLVSPLLLFDSAAPAGYHAAFSRLYRFSMFFEQSSPTSYKLSVKAEY